MISFEKDEFEIAILTYNRARFIENWLNCCYKDACDRNITISIYDSSSNDETELLVNEFVVREEYQIEYHRLPVETVLGYKPMIPILNSTKKYVWVCGDSRRHDFSELDEKVFKYIKKDYDYLLFLVDQKQEARDYSTADLNTFICECFIPSTCIGFSIYKTSLFAYLKNNPQLLMEYNSKFEDNYGFGWLGYFYNAFAQKDNKARTCNVKTINIFPRKKKQVWAKRFYECWIDNLIQIIDNIPDTYIKKDIVPRIVWDGLKLYSDQFCYLARKCGDLNKVSYDAYDSDGILNRITTHKRNIKFYAKAPLCMIEVKYYIYITFLKCGTTIKKVVRLVRGER